MKNYYPGKFEDLHQEMSSLLARPDDIWAKGRAIDILLDTIMSASDLIKEAEDKLPELEDENEAEELIKIVRKYEDVMGWYSK